MNTINENRELNLEEMEKVCGGELDPTLGVMTASFFICPPSIFGFAAAHWFGWM